MSVWSNYVKCMYMLSLPLKKIAHQGLIICFENAIFQLICSKSISVIFAHEGFNSTCELLDRWPGKSGVGSGVENAGYLLIFFTSLDASQEENLELCYAPTGKK